MARTLNEIQQSILLKKTEAAELNALEILTNSEINGNVTSDSKVAIWRLWVYIVAFAIWTFEGILDSFKEVIETLIAAKRIHNFGWYKDKVLAFRYGHNLVGDTDAYSDEGYTAEEIANAQIISHTAIVRRVANGRGTLLVKVAKEENNDLAPLTANELIAFDNYMFKVGDAGTLITPQSSVADSLKLELDVYFNPLVLKEDGLNILTGAYPVPIATREFLHNLEFNGELILTKLTDYLQKVEGVEMPVIKLAMAKYGLLPWVEINETYIADAGYMRIEDVDLTINYIAREQ